MTGPKRNEGASVAGENTGTKATAKYLRSSAYKAREVLDLIRGLDVRAADEMLQFLERDVAQDIRKVLASAVANAVHNDEMDPDDLYVRACFADEGPTLKRFRPRARGRAARIRKRTSHITVVVDTLNDDMMKRRSLREAAKPTTGRRAPSSAAAARRARVERSRAAAAAKAAGDDAVTEETTDATTESQSFVDTTATEAPYGEGSAVALEDGSAPEGFTIKGNADSMLYHVPGSSHYKQTVAEVWFATEEAAEAAGFQKPPSQRDSDAAAEPPSDTEEEA
jgi:large subunit ribosomal protein L22